MAGMIKSIFGLDTQDIMQKRAEDIRQKALLRTKAGDIDPTVAILGESLGNVLGRGLLSKLGYEDKEMSKALLGEQFTKDIRNKLDSGELDPTSKEYNLLMADYYGKLGDTENQLKQLQLYGTKKNQEIAINDKVLGRYIQLKEPTLGLSEKQIIDRLKIAFPTFDYSKLSVLNEGSDTLFGNKNNKNTNNKNTKPKGKTDEEVENLLGKGAKEEEKSWYEKISDVFFTNDNKDKEKIKEINERNKRNQEMLKSLFK